MVVEKFNEIARGVNCTEISDNFLNSTEGKKCVEKLACSKEFIDFVEKNNTLTSNPEALSLAVTDNIAKFEKGKQDFLQLKANASTLTSNATTLFQGNINKIDTEFNAVIDAYNATAKDMQKCLQTGEVINGTTNSTCKKVNDNQNQNENVIGPGWVVLGGVAAFIFLLGGVMHLRREEEGGRISRPREGVSPQREGELPNYGSRMVRIHAAELSSHIHINNINQG
jgi:hypothetical protein